MEVEVVELVEEVVVEVVAQVEVEVEVENWLMLTFTGRWWTRRSLGRLQECIIYFLSQNPCWKLLYIFSPQILTGNFYIFFSSQILTGNFAGNARR